MHGVSGHAFGSWSNRDGACWPRDFLGQSFGNLRVMTFGFDCRIDRDTSTSRLSDYGNTLLQCACAARNSEEVCKESRTGIALLTIRQAANRPLVFIGHSFGGTVIAFVSAPGKLLSY